MNLYFIEKYIKKIKKEDIYKYALTQNITLTSIEIDILYSYLKTHYKDFLTNPNIRLTLLAELKSQVSPKVSSKLDELYNQYKYKL